MISQWIQLIMYLYVSISNNPKISLTLALISHKLRNSAQRYDSAACPVSHLGPQRLGWTQKTGTLTGPWSSLGPASTWRVLPSSLKPKRVGKNSSNCSNIINGVSTLLLSCICSQNFPLRVTSGNETEKLGLHNEFQRLHGCQPRGVTCTHLSGL